MNEMPWFFKIFNQEIFKKEKRMREILFRGKTKEGEWIEGSLVTGLFRTNSGEDVPYILNVDGVDYSCFEDLSDYGGGYYEVLPETVGEYTGIRDKNGKRIFEGDILLEDRDGIPVAWVVKWRDGALEEWSIHNENAEEWIKLPIRQNKEREVVGNILYDRELLKKFSFIRGLELFAEKVKERR